MFRLFATLAVTLFSGFRSRRDLVLENLALRQQLATLLHKHQPRIRLPDRLFWILLRRFWSMWADVVVIVKPQDRGRLAPGWLRSLLEVVLQIGSSAWATVVPRQNPVS